MATEIWPVTVILVIEDQAKIRDNILETLEMEGYRIHGARNGMTGVQLARAHHPDLIICDIMMPGMDGYTVLMELQNDPATTTIPFIFLTARADRESQRQGMELGADDYLTKPFTRAELLAAVTTRLQKQAARERKYGADSHN
jgi:DNA-binding response OmpR family regulator